MAKEKRLAGPSVLTANEILTGAIVYWTGSDWSTDIETAERAGPDARAPLEDVGRREEAANRVVGAYLMALDPVTGEPVLLRERRRLSGPSFALPTAHQAA
ncbi:DUF2849 domain-containing protein [Acuticoccus sp. I52.16.1]|uniref:DUF2849 domain-containing protein n=1 Tax=Acuticoccus sp. I52.16.1 TaxID=2928472 RepID=UPI001FD2E018|nr:DUF2849 domain-containing protein [Acuticoccus sp. I52.16.1]UOM34694.1 DUF2849 domain-containing protein [Acuticoccus sp. I52.16.1]